MTKLIAAIMAALFAVATVSPAFAAADEKKTTAWHEAGHTLVAALLPPGAVDPIHKVTIIPRGRALGVTHFLPEQDKLSYDQRNAEGMIAVSLGGRIAEDPGGAHRAHTGDETSGGRLSRRPASPRLAGGP